MEAKIHIKLSEGLVEAEGSEEFVKYIYDSVKDNLFSSNFIKPPVNPSPNQNGEIKQDEKVKRPSKKITKTPAIVNSLNLRPSDGKLSLEDFYNTLKVGDNYFEKNLVFTYYLQKILETTNISDDHIYTCYKHMKAKVSNNLYQSIVDTKNRKGWIDSTNINDIKVTIAGENYVEHDMKKENEIS